MTILIACPFCSDTGFDLPGLKFHLQLHCEAYEKTEMPETTWDRMSKRRAAMNLKCRVCDGSYPCDEHNVEP